MRGRCGQEGTVPRGTRTFPASLIRKFLASPLNGWIGVIVSSDPAVLCDAAQHSCYSTNPVRRDYNIDVNAYNHEVEEQGKDVAKVRAVRAAALGVLKTNDA